MSELVWDVLESQEDDSVNFVAATNDGGNIETRFVQREPDHFIIYLSSHTGCNKSCRMCHLTATGQTTMTDVTPEQYIEQARRVFDYWETMDPIAMAIRYYRLNSPYPLSAFDIPTREDNDHVHFNFMARGEPLANKYMLRTTSETFDSTASTIIFFQRSKSRRSCQQRSRI